MDLKELLNQTTIGKSEADSGDSSDCDETNSGKDDSVNVDMETLNNSTQEPEPDNSTNLDTSYNELEEEVEKEIIDEIQNTFNLTIQQAEEKYESWWTIAQNKNKYYSVFSTKEPGIETNIIQ